MLKNGVFCMYNGLEYQYSKNIQEDTLIITQDKLKIDSFFIDKYGSGVYSKKVNIEEIYEIYTFGKIGNLKVNVENELEDYYIVGTSNLEIAKKTRIGAL